MFGSIASPCGSKSSLGLPCRCSQIMGRNETDELSAAQIFYPCMQCADIFFLKVNEAQMYPLLGARCWSSAGCGHQACSPSLWLMVFHDIVCALLEGPLCLLQPFVSLCTMPPLKALCRQTSASWGWTSERSTCWRASTVMTAGPSAS